MTPRLTLQEQTMSSREIADLVEARHNDVVASIERLFDKGLLRSSRKTRHVETGGRPIEAGRFVVKAGVAKANEHAFNTTKFTPKGVEWVAGLWGQHQAKLALEGGVRA